LTGGDTKQSRSSSSTTEDSIEMAPRVERRPTRSAGPHRSTSERCSCRSGTMSLALRARRSVEPSVAARVLSSFVAEPSTMYRIRSVSPRHGHDGRKRLEMLRDGEVSSAAKARCVGRRWRAASAEFRAARESASTRRERVRASKPRLRR
jgi:hypothetical protein